MIVLVKNYNYLELITKPPEERRKAAYILRITRLMDVTFLLEQLLPHLIVKREKAQEVLSVQWMKYQRYKMQLEAK